jgi:hypothetical protein
MVGSRKAPSARTEAGWGRRTIPLAFPRATTQLMIAPPVLTAFAVRCCDASGELRAADAFRDQLGFTSQVSGSP